VLSVGRKHKYYPRATEHHQVVSVDRIWFKYYPGLQSTIRWYL